MHTTWKRRVIKTY